MSWVANQIYAKPSPGVAEALSREPFLANQMFLIDDLEGIRFQWVRDRFFSDNLPDDDCRIRHGLPEGGLLAVSPHLYSNGYAVKDPPPIEFQELFFENRPSHGSSPHEKWAKLQTNADTEILFPAGWDQSYYPVRLLKFLKSVATETASPIVYYWASMWGGAVDEEVGWAFDDVDHVYQYVDEDTAVDHTAERQRTETERNALQMLMAHVGLHLPTAFFALHEGSFDWKRYWLCDRA